MLKHDKLYKLIQSTEFAEIVTSAETFTIKNNQIIIDNRDTTHILKSREDLEQIKNEDTLDYLLIKLS